MKWILIPALIIFVTACNNEKGPDVSGIPVNIKFHRFDRFMYEQLDTSNMPVAMNQMEKQFPFFATDFLRNILGLPMSVDSSTPYSSAELKRFIRITRPLYDSITPVFKDTDD